MWFTPEQIKTAALQKLVRYNSSKIENELANVLLNTMERYILDLLHICVYFSIIQLKMVFQTSERKKIIVMIGLNQFSDFQKMIEMKNIVQE